MPKKNSFEQHCQTCRLASFCFPVNLTEQEVALLDDIVEDKLVFHRGDYIYRADSPFTDLYIIRSGSIKNVHTNQQGQPQITGFWYPGEILGFEAIYDERHHEAAIALETTSTCKLKFTKLQEIAKNIPNLQSN